MTGNLDGSKGLALVRGIPLDQEDGIGALTLGGFLRDVTRAYGPAEAAVIHLDGQVIRWSYTDLWEYAHEVARALIAAGVSKGSRVAILATNRPEFLSCVFGAALAGGVATPISTFFTPSELEAVLKMAAPSVLLVERHVLKKDFAAMLAALDPAIATAEPGRITSEIFPFLRHVVLIGDEVRSGATDPGPGFESWAGFLARGAHIRPAMVDACAAAVYPADPGILLFSSGSTGKAKGILSAHRGVCLMLWRWRRFFNVQQPPRTWSANGFFWSGNFAQALGGTLPAGGTLVLQRWFDAAEALELMAAERATMVVAWPHQWAQLTAAPGYADADLSSLYYVDALTPLARHPSVNTDWREPGAAYGNTETFTLISVFPSGTPQHVVANSHGLPTAGSTIRIIDPLTGETLAVGERGEIAVKGPTLMLGYVGVPLDETLDADGFLRTSDGGYIDAEGRLYWEGRLNDIIKTGGANVSPLEIDAVIRECPGVKISQTVGVPDELLGELVVTAIVRHDGAKLDEAMVQNFAKAQLASYKVPRRVIFVAEDDIKTTGSAKIRTAELRELAARRLQA